jgi:hypothetical protein
MSTREKWVIFTNIDNVYGDMTYHTGLNTDFHHFNTTKEFGKGGFYFCKIEHAHLFRNLRNYPHFMWDVELPEGEFSLMD